jgi:DNA-binding NtrC family response regulator
VKLLRALQEGAVEAVGARKPVKVDVRIISATNRNLLERAKSGHFREDLFYRLHVLPLTVPPLRARSEDVPHLLRHFLARFCAEENRSINAVAADAMAALSAYAWPGNVRQLENAVYRAVVISEGATLGLADFPLLAASADAHAAASIVAADMPAEPLTRQQPHMIGHDIPIAPAPPAASLSLVMADGEVRPIEEIETDVIRFAIAHYRGQMSEVARRLKIGRSTLYRKLESMDGKTPEPADGD